MSNSDIDLFANYLLANWEKKCVSIKPIAEKIGILLPNHVKELSMADPESSLKLIPSVIIRNFARNYANEEDFPLNALNTLLRILRRTDKDGHVLQVMMVHLAKAAMTVADAVDLYTHVERLVLLPELSTRTLIWKTFAEQTIMHPQIVETVDELIVQNFAKVESMVAKPISVEFVNIPSFAIRGFSGFNKVFINHKHFWDNANEFAADDREAIVSKIDIACVAMYEYGHVRLRQALNDFNISTPFAMTPLENQDRNEMEFGRMVEKMFFYGQVQWWKSREIVSMDYIKSFISAIESGTTLPILDKKPIPSYRLPCVASGVDITDEKSQLLC